MTAFDFLRGVYNITPTPFLDDGTLDEGGIARLADFTVGRGVHGMTILGVLGEAHKLTERERDTVIEKTVEAVAGRIPVCVGTSAPGTDVAVAFSRRAQALGARAVMVAPPKLARATDAALLRHYATVADAISIPVVVQDHPTSSGVLMDVDLLAALGEKSPMCRTVKLEDEPSPVKIAQLRAANPNLRMFGGLGGNMFLEELKRGAVGTMTGFGFPEILVRIYTAFTAGRVDEATEVFYRYCPLIRFENQPRINLPIRKQIYHRRGAIGSPRGRFPIAELDEGTLADLEDLLVRLGLVESPAAPPAR